MSHQKETYKTVTKLTPDGIKENHKEFVKKYKSILKTQEGFKSERYNIFIEKIN